MPSYSVCVCVHLLAEVKGLGQHHPFELSCSSGGFLKEEVKEIWAIEENAT